MFWYTFLKFYDDAEVCLNYNVIKIFPICELCYKLANKIKMHKSVVYISFDRYKSMYK